MGKWSEIVFDDLKKFADIEELYIFGKEYPLSLLLDTLSIETLHLIEYDEQSRGASILCSKTLRMLFLHQSSLNYNNLADLVLESPNLETLYIDRIGNLYNPKFPVAENRFNLFSEPLNSKMITSVSLTNCGITSLLGVDFLRRASELRMLSLAYNKLVEIDNLNFLPEKTTKLYYLDLSHNELKTLPRGWQVPSSVRILLLNQNHFTEFDPTHFEDVWSRLHEFWMSGKLWSCFQLNGKTCMSTILSLTIVVDIFSKN